MLKARRTGLPLAASIAMVGLAGSAVTSGAQEKLPWADKPISETVEAPAGDTAATEAAEAQCAGQFEASCRDLKKVCAWVGDVSLQDGTLVPARCVARPPAPPKKAAKKPAPTKPKTEAKTAPAPEGAAPAVKASVTRSEPEANAVPPSVAEPERPAPATVAVEAPDAAPPAASSATDEPKAAEPKAAEVEAKPEAQEKKADQAKAPIVVTPPSAGAQPKEAAPSFGAIKPVMPGGSGAIVVTVPPSE